MRTVGVTRVFEKNFEADKPVIVNRGGARSSKSFSIIQYLIYCLTNQHNCKILVTRKTMPALKVTTYKDFIDILREYDLYRFCEHNKTDNILIYKPTNGFVLFSSLDNPEKMKSSSWNYIFMEEANEFTYNDYMVLKLRLSAPSDKQNKLIMALNPTDAFCYVKTDILDKEKNVTEIFSNYKDNPYLPQDYIDLLLSTKDPYYFKVYVEGEWGVLENLIYPEWVEVETLPNAEKTIYGLDFGYNDPTALVECRFTEDGVFVKELLYQSGMTNSELIDWCLNNINIDVLCYADSAEPQRIEELRRAGLNIRPTVKGQDSVRKGIDTVKAQNLYLSSDSVNLIKEIRAYRWAEDKEGKPTNKPAEGFDHLVDAMRYGIHMYLNKQRSYKVIVGD